MVRPTADDSSRANSRRDQSQQPNTSATAAGSSRARCSLRVLAMASWRSTARDELAGEEDDGHGGIEHDMLGVGGPGVQGRRGRRPTSRGRSPGC